ncbi:MAG: porin [Acidobacteriota bacterium]
MFRRFLITAIAAALVSAFWVLPASAQDANEALKEHEEGKQHEWVAKWSNGHKIEKGKAFKLKFGGRIQADYSFFSVDSDLTGPFGADVFQDGFEFRRARLFFEGTIYDRVSFKAQYDFAGGDADFKDVWIGLDFDFGKLRFGHFKEFFSLEELTSSKYLAFMERSLPVEAFAPSRNSGVGIDGGGEKLNWGFGVFYDADDFGESISEERYNATGRIGFRPIVSEDGKRLLHVGAGINWREIGDIDSILGDARFRARPENHLTTRLVDTSIFPADGATIWNLELAGVFNRFWFSGEYFNNSVDAPEVDDPTFTGWYAQAGFYLTDDHRRFKNSYGVWDRQKPHSSWDLKDGGIGAWEIAIRFSSVDLADGLINGGKEDNYTLGINWYLNPATRLMLNWVHADVKDGNIPILDARPDGSGDAYMMRWQVDF